MRYSLTVRLPTQLERDLRRECRAEGIGRSELVRRAIRAHIFVTRFRTLRNRLFPKACRRGIFTDQDVFDRIS